jgi:hypothetical protein
MLRRVPKHRVPAPMQDRPMTRAKTLPTPALTRSTVVLLAASLGVLVAQVGTSVVNLVKQTSSDPRVESRFGRNGTQVAPAGETHNERAPQQRGSFSFNNLRQKRAANAQPIDQLLE